MSHHTVRILLVYKKKIAAENYDGNYKTKIQVLEYSNIIEYNNIIVNVYVDRTLHLWAM